MKINGCLDIKLNSKIYSASLVNLIIRKNGFNELKYILDRVESMEVQQNNEALPETPVR